MEQDFKIVISCNKHDFFLTRVCVASIRYYYPEIEIYLLKDLFNGYFDTSEIEQALGVKLLKLSKEKFGWGAAKMHFILSNQFQGSRVFVLDSDIVFVGKFLKEVCESAKDYDFVVDPDYYDNPDAHIVQAHYYDYNKLKEIDPEFTFPGYVFNTGQLVVSTAKLKKDEVEPFYDAEHYPYYKRLDVLHMVDQSLLNYILSKKEQVNDIKIAKMHFWKWSESDEVKKINLNEVKVGDVNRYLIHYAGALRIPNISKMTRADILLFFEDYYYSFVPGGFIKKQYRRSIAKSDYYLRKLYRQRIKKIINLKSVLKRFSS